MGRYRRPDIWNSEQSPPAWEAMGVEPHVCPVRPGGAGRAGTGMPRNVGRSSVHGGLGADPSTLGTRRSASALRCPLRARVVGRSTWGGGRAGLAPGYGDAAPSGRQRRRPAGEATGAAFGAQGDGWARRPRAASARGYRLRPLRGPRHRRSAVALASGPEHGRRRPSGAATTGRTTFGRGACGSPPDGAPGSNRMPPNLSRPAASVHR